MMKKFNLTKANLIKGVICPDCGALPMVRYKQKWLCHSCGCISADAHLQALLDYALLVSEYISNREAREFLLVDSIHIVKRLLQKEKFEQFGVRGGRRYRIDVEKLQFANVHSQFAKVHRQSANVHK